MLRLTAQLLVSKMMKTHTEEQTIALENIRQGLATRVRILVPDHACPVCQHYAGAYELDDVPQIPFPGCSCPGGCRAVYEPVLDQFGP